MKTRTSAHAGPYPHRAGCQDCRTINKCDVCGAHAGASTRCTNGRCPKCHASVCTDGGGTRPGHGFGKAPAAQSIGKVGPPVILCQPCGAPAAWETDEDARERRFACDACKRKGEAEGESIYWMTLGHARPKFPEVGPFVKALRVDVRREAATIGYEARVGTVARFDIMNAALPADGRSPPVGTIRNENVADEIVRRWNAHAGLVAALKRIRAKLDAVGGMVNARDCVEIAADALAKVRA